MVEYKKYCKAKTLHINESEQSFSRKLKREYELTDMQMRDGGDIRRYYWIGIKLKDWKRKHYL